MVDQLRPLNDLRPPDLIEVWPSIWPSIWPRSGLDLGFDLAWVGLGWGWGGVGVGLGCESPKRHLHQFDVRVLV